REIVVAVESEVLGDELERRVDAARADRDTVGGVIEVRARGVPPGLGSYATKDERLDARLAGTLMGAQAGKGGEIGDGVAPADRRGSGGAERAPRGGRRVGAPHGRRGRSPPGTRRGTSSLRTPPTWTGSPATARANPSPRAVGFMGAGKSTLGSEVAERLGRPFIDLDR